MLNGPKNHWQGLSSANSTGHTSHRRSLTIPGGVRRQHEPVSLSDPDPLSKPEPVSVSFPEAKRVSVSEFEPVSLHIWAWTMTLWAWVIFCIEHQHTLLPTSTVLLRIFSWLSLRTTSTILHLWQIRLVGHPWPATSDLTVLAVPQCLHYTVSAFRDLEPKLYYLCRRWPTEERRVLSHNIIVCCVKSPTGLCKLILFNHSVVTMGSE